MKMIVAVNNKVIEEKVVKKYAEDYDIYLAKSTDIVYSLVCQNEKIVLLIREDINGEIKFKDLIIKLKCLSKNIQIIVLVKKLDQNLKEFLFSKEVFNIIEGLKFSLDSLVDLIENPRIVVYKYLKNQEKNNKVICITGSRGVGKTILSLVISNIIAKDRTKRVALIDLDFISPTLDTYLDVNKNYSLLDYIKDLNDNKLKDIKNYETSDSRHYNLKYILNSKSIPVPSTVIITKIIDSLQNYYDYVVVDTSKFIKNNIYSIAKENSYNLLHIIEATKKPMKEYALDTIYIDENLLSYASIVCNKVFLRKRLKSILNNMSFSVNGYVYFSFILSYKNKYKERYLKYNLKYILRKLNIGRIFNLKNKLIERILKYKEDNYE